MSARSNQHPAAPASDIGHALNAGDWFSWYSRVVTAQQHPDDRELEHIRRMCEPPLLWHGAPGVSALLQDRWQHYLSMASVRKAQMQQRLPAPYGRFWATLWKELTPARGTLDALYLYGIAYPASVVHLLPPATVVLSLGDYQPTDGELRATFHAAVRNLTAGGAM